MLAKSVGFAIVLFWAVATSWLVWRDVLPAWTAQDPPQVVAADWVKQYGREAQFGVFDADGRRIGDIWTRYTSGSTTDREDDIYLNDFPVLGPTHIHVQSVFDVDGHLDEIDIDVLGDWNPIRIHGERFPSQFAIRIDAGLTKQVFKIDLARAGTFSDMFRPFDAMPNLRVGQSWRMRVIDPLATVMRGPGQFNVVLVRVTAKEMIQHQGESVECFRVESPQIVAFVTDDGRATVRDGDRVVAQLPIELLSDPPQYTREGVKPSWLDALQSYDLAALPDISDLAGGVPLNTPTNAEPDAGGNLKVASTPAPREVGTDKDHDRHGDPCASQEVKADSHPHGR